MIGLVILAPILAFVIDILLPVYVVVAKDEIVSEPVIKLSISTNLNTLSPALNVLAGI